MAERYTVRNTVFESGERFPLLVDVRTGVPLFDPTVFVLSEFRARNRASATIEQVLRALKVFLLFCDQHRIDLARRMLEGQLLELGELDALVQLCRLPMSDIEAQVDACTTASGRAAVSIESYRARANRSLPEVAGDSAGVRIRYIRQFIGWLADRRLLSLSARHPSRAVLLNARDILVAGLAARIPTGKSRNKTHSRRALDDAAQERLWQVVDINSPENPWQGRHARVRNELIVRWFMGLGVRRGELLGVKVNDVNFRANEVFIARRADDPSDPRVHQPNAKTADRLLPISDDLARRTRHYILEERRRFPEARRHAFLFVANGGAPLSLRGLNKIFSVLSAKHPELMGVFPHLFRHTNNYNFSKNADEQGMDPEKEKKTRSHLMGWSETSGTAETYTRREIERKARVASLQLQNKMVKPHNENE
ncbi:MULTISPECIES: tyrosine-type recombinase/integrase [Paraburkholderia]|jgi:integrase|uniref:Site-specific integrase n=1 Tax=Paraburkholderia hospita TaxID=169430 RepID=A0AAN1J5C7_9BURK|nr:site-specific integrase [Paraburkholderia hospita]AUT67234.1 site-specific integrase [Paraburkholderia hospita]SEH43574.1 Site-specific recombinase XerD [Paraburkholderia hospita]